MESQDLRCEKWISSDDNREIHYFISDSLEYVFGYNPKFLTKKDVDDILNLIHKRAKENSNGNHS